MDKQRTRNGPEKTTGTIKVTTGKAIGSRHSGSEGETEKKTGGRFRGGVDALDAVREVVNNEK